MIKKGDPVYESRMMLTSNSTPIVGSYRTGDVCLGWACHDAKPGQDIGDSARVVAVEATGMLRIRSERWPMEIEDFRVRPDGVEWLP